MAVHCVQFSTSLVGEGISFNALSFPSNINRDHYYNKPTFEKIFNSSLTSWLVYNITLVRAFYITMILSTCLYGESGTQIMLLAMVPIVWAFLVSFFSSLS